MSYGEVGGPWWWRVSKGEARARGCGGALRCEIAILARAGAFPRFLMKVGECANTPGVLSWIAGRRAPSDCIFLQTDKPDSVELDERSYGRRGGHSMTAAGTSRQSLTRVGVRGQIDERHA